MQAVLAVSPRGREEEELESRAAKSGLNLAPAHAHWPALGRLAVAPRQQQEVPPNRQERTVRLRRARRAATAASAAAITAFDSLPTALAEPSARRVAVVRVVVRLEALDELQAVEGLAVEDEVKLEALRGAPRCSAQFGLAPHGRALQDGSNRGVGCS